MLTGLAVLVTLSIAPCRFGADGTLGMPGKTNVPTTAEPRGLLAEGLPQIQGDRVQLQQVMINLIMNGIEAMAGVAEARRDLLISSSKGDAEVLVAVADTGPGLTAETLEQVFAAFYTTKPGGLGLGLSICRSIIEAHDGRLWASANDGGGAIFQVMLPGPPR